MPVVGPPRGTGTAGRQLFQSVTGDFELDGHERLLLLQAVVTADRITELDSCVAADGILLGGTRVHPALVEARLQRITLARLLAALRLPDKQEHRPQRRAGFRGHYGLREVSG